VDWLTQRFEVSRGGAGQNIRPMEGLRGFAVCLVFLVHYVTLVRPWIAGESALLGLSSALHTMGNTGVDLFFVLSGYLIYASLLSRSQPFVRFLARRVARLYPPFVAVFVLYVVLSLACPTENKIPVPISQGLLYLVQNLLLLPGLFPVKPMITVAWSLSYEMFYYVALPLVITLFRLRDRSTMWRVAFFASVAVGTALYCAAYGGPVRLIMFVAGILLHEAIKNHSGLRPSSVVGLVALTLGLLVPLLPLAGASGLTLKVSMLFVAFFVLCLACFRHPSAWLPRMFAWPPVRWLGNMSYSYYLLHGLALKAGFLALAVVLPRTDHGFWLFWALLPAMFALTLVPAAVLFLAVERPYSLAPRRAALTPASVPL